MLYEMLQKNEEGFSWTPRKFYDLYALFAHLKMGVVILFWWDTLCRMVGYALV